MTSALPVLVTRTSVEIKPNEKWEKTVKPSTRMRKKRN